MLAHIHTHTYTHIHTQTFTHTHTDTHTHTHTHTNTLIYTHTHSHTHTHTHAFITYIHNWKLFSEQPYHHDPLFTHHIYYTVGVHVKKIEFIPKDFENFTYKCLTFFTYTKIYQNFSLVPKKLREFQV